MKFSRDRSLPPELTQYEIKQAPLQMSRENLPLVSLGKFVIQSVSSSKVTFTISGDIYEVSGNFGTSPISTLEDLQGINSALNSMVQFSIINNVQTLRFYAEKDAAEPGITIGEFFRNVEEGTNSALQSGNDVLYGTNFNNGLGFGSLGKVVTGDVLYARAGRDTVYGYAGDDEIWAGAGDDFVDAGSGSDTVIGGSGNDTLNGGEGNDVLFGGTGANSLVGGAGDDIYYVDSARDVIVERATDNTPSQQTFSLGNQNDVVVASVSYTLSADAAVEDLMARGPLTGADSNAAINLTGNNFAQGLIGNDAQNRLSGMGGDDVLFGAGGDDTLLGGDGNDALMGGLGNDSLAGGAGDDVFCFNFGVSVTGTNLVGEQGSVFLTGGSDTADGGAGTDTLAMTGQFSDYKITKINANQFVIQLRSGIGDPVSEQMTFSFIESLKFGSIDSLLNNTGQITTLSMTDTTVVSNLFYRLTGTSAANTLSGGAQGDYLDGSAGNDRITGNGGSDTLIGGAGSDTLTGGAGADFFCFTTAPNAVSNVDNIADFLTAQGDKIRLDNRVMQGLGGATGTLTQDAFYKAAGASAGRDATDRVIYDTSSGKLYYDADGNASGGVAAVQIALIGNRADLNASDFVIISQI